MTLLVIPGGVTSVFGPSRHLLPVTKAVAMDASDGGSLKIDMIDPILNIGLGRMVTSWVHSAGLASLIPIRKQKMLRYVCALGLFILAASTAAANPTALPGLIHAPLSVPIALPDGRRVTLEGLVIRPDAPENFRSSSWCMGRLGPSQERLLRRTGVARQRD